MSFKRLAVLLPLLAIFGGCASNRVATMPTFAFITIISLLCSVSVRADDTLADLYPRIDTIESPHQDQIGGTDVADKIELSAHQWQQAGLDAIEPYRTDANYAVYGSIRSDAPVLLLERDFDQESVHWLVMLTEAYQHRAHRVIAYDNAEGFRLVHSVIDGDTITITEWNQYPEPNQAQHRFSLSNGTSWDSR